MIVEYEQPDTSTKLFGYSMPDGTLRKATGRLKHGYHHKCFWAVRKREHRGESGTVVAGVPTAYQIHDLVFTRDELDALGASPAELDQARSTAYLTERLTQLRDIARQVGKGVGDATVIEAYRAHEHGGPYPHTHHLPLDRYQLTAHLVYAHGHDPDEALPANLHALHGEYHARSALDATATAREADPGHAEPEARDWRHQDVADV